VSRRLVLNSITLGPAAVAVTGCWGSFNLTGRLYDWNGHFESKWASWGVFAVFVILPVYGTTLFVDAVVLNTIEFFSGKKIPDRPNRIQGAENIQNSTKPGKKNKKDESLRDVDATDGPRTVRLDVEGRPEARLVRVGPRDVRAETGQGVVAYAGPSASAPLVLRDADGRVLARIDELQFARVRDAIMAGEGIGLAVDDCLADLRLAGRRAMVFGHTEGRGA
jgi:hypothetical protein